MVAKNQPNYYIHGPRPEHDLGDTRRLRHEPDNHVPKTLEEATVFVLGELPAEVEAYSGRLDIQLSVAEEIARIIFCPGEPINSNYIRWLNRDLPTNEPATELRETVLGDSRLPQAIGLVATQTLEEQREAIANARYVPSSIPIKPPTIQNRRSIETLTTEVL